MPLCETSVTIIGAEIGFGRTISISGIYFHAHFSENLHGKGLNSSLFPLPRLKSK